MKIQRSSTHEDGMSTLDFMIGVALFLIVTVAVGYNVRIRSDEAKVAAARTLIGAFCTALESYNIDCGRYPTAEQGLQALWEKPTIQPISDKWSGPYINKEIPNDPWGNPYEYTTPGHNGLPYSIRSLGADSKEGGEGNNADITSWGK